MAITKGIGLKWLNFSYKNAKKETQNFSIIKWLNWKQKNIIIIFEGATVFFGVWNFWVFKDYSHTLLWIWFFKDTQNGIGISDCFVYWFEIIKNRMHISVGNVFVFFLGKLREKIINVLFIKKSLYLFYIWILYECTFVIFNVLKMHFKIILSLSIAIFICFPFIFNIYILILIFI